MALPASGALAMSAINTELGRTSTTANTSLAGGTTPTAGSLFGLATGTINKTAPHAISEFYGYTQPSGGSLLLDTYSGGSAAFSLRKLRTAYTGACIRVQRSSDSTQQDIGFSGNFLDTTALANFVGSGTGSVVTWYDQGPNGYNITKGPAAAPTIRVSGVNQTLNGKIALNFNGTQTVYGVAFPSVVAANGTFIAFGVGSVTDTSTRLMVHMSAGAGANAQVFRRSGTVMQAITYNTSSATVTESAALNPGTAQFTIALNRGVSSAEIFVNNQSNGATALAGTPFNPGTVNIVVGCFNPAATPSFAWNGMIQEVVYFNLDPASNTTYRNNVTTAINSYYGAYV